MSDRPWSIITAAFSFIILPFLILIIVALSSRASFYDFTASFLRNLHVWRSWYAVALVGLCFCTYQIKPWSYSVLWVLLSSVVGTSIYLSMHTFVEGFRVVHIGIATSFALIGIYLLKPSVRKIFLDMRLQWWNTQARYLIDAQGTLNTDTKKTSCTVVDIARGGAYIETSENLQTAQNISLSFKMADLDFAITAQVIQKRSGKSEGYGVFFIPKTSDDEQRINKLCEGLKMMGKAARQIPRPFYQRLGSWMKEF